MSNSRLPRKPIPELLAPAGDWDCLRAAVANGADAVYFGLPTFNARHRATNFALDELPHIMRYLHDHHVKGFVTLNTLIFSDELPQVVEYLRLIAACGVNAVIVQDLGVVRLIKRFVPSLSIHASTQMTLTDPRGIEFARQLGVERVVLARELSLTDIGKVTRQTDMPVEVFVHGALCVAYSGQCLTSESLGGRSANRGQCAQACRLPYEMVVDGLLRDLGDRAYLLSPQDLAAFDCIDELTEHGVVSFKIEGRLKTPQYVAATTQTYRRAIDASAAKQDFTLSTGEQRDLAMTFSRGFTPGFLEGVDHQQLVQGRFPKSRGVQVGNVASITPRGFVLQLLENGKDFLKPGDGVVFDLGRPEESEPGGRIWTVRELDHRNGLIEISFEVDAVDASKISVGCAVWKTDDPALRKRLDRTFAGDPTVRRIGLVFHISGNLGGPLSLQVRDPQGNEASVEWPGPLEAAKRHPLTLESAHEQLDRLGDTPFALAQVDFDLSDNVMVPKSVLNDLRRQVINQLRAVRESRSKYPIGDPNALHHLRVESRGTNNEHRPVRFTVMARTLEQLDAVLSWQPSSMIGRPAMVYCDFEDPRRYREAVKRARECEMPIGLATLRIIKPGEDGFFNPIVESAPDAVLIRNLAGLQMAKERLPQAELIGDFSLNVANELTAAIFFEDGLSRLVPSYDLNWDQLAALIRHSDPGRFEPVIHQHMPMFHMEHCVFAAFLSKGKDFRDCGRPCDHHRVELRDRVGAEFPVLPDTGCRNTVFNSMAQSAAEYVAPMLQLGLRWFRIELLRERPEQVGPLLETYARVMSGHDPGKETWRRLRVLNQLGVTRGTLQMV